MYTAVTG